MNENLRVLGLVIIGGVGSLCAGLAMVFGATRIMGCIGEQLSCNINEAIGTILCLIATPLAMVVFGVVAWRWPSRRMLAIAALLLAFIPLSIFLILAPARIALLQNLPEFVARDVQFLFQAFFPLFLIILVQWQVLRMGHFGRVARGVQ